MVWAEKLPMMGNADWDPYTQIMGEWGCSLGLGDILFMWQVVIDAYGSTGDDEEADVQVTDTDSHTLNLCCSTHSKFIILCSSFSQELVKR